MNEKNIIKLDESKIRCVVENVLRGILNENMASGLDENEIMTLAKIVVNKYGTGNMIDLSNPEELVSNVQQVMQRQNCDEYEALKYMSGANGGGWG